MVPRPGVGFGVEDEQVVDGAGLPVGRLGAGAFQREAVVFDAAQRGGQVGYHLLRPGDPDRLGDAPGVAGHRHLHRPSAAVQGHRH
jgi:hypothetical protein